MLPKTSSQQRSAAMGAFDIGAKCGTCRCWSGERTADEEAGGECRRYPPMSPPAPGQFAVFPSTAAGVCCGEWLTIGGE